MDNDYEWIYWSSSIFKKKEKECLSIEKSIYLMRNLRNLIFNAIDNFEEYCYNNKALTLD